MSKQVIIVSSSPRKNGNSVLLAEQAAAGARAAGAKVEIIDLAKLTLAPCNGCEACLRSFIRGYIQRLPSKGKTIL